MATPSSILAWRIPQTEEPGGLQSMGCKESDVTEHAHTCVVEAVYCVSETNTTLEINYASIKKSKPEGEAMLREKRGLLASV